MGFKQLFGENASLLDQSAACEQLCSRDYCCFRGGWIFRNASIHEDVYVDGTAAPLSRRRCW